MYIGDVTSLRIAATALLLTTWLSGCTSPCQSAIDQLDKAMWQASAEAGTGIQQANTGDYHFGVAISKTALLSLLSQVDLEIGVLQAREQIIEDRSRVTLILRAEPHLLEIRPIADSEDQVQVVFTSDVKVTVATPGRAAEYVIATRLSIPGELQFASDDHGVPMVVAQLESIEQGVVELGQLSVEDEIRSAVSHFVMTELGESHLSLGRIPLLRFPSISVLGLPVNPLPIGLEISPLTGTLYLGFTTNLRPRSRQQLSRNWSVEEGEIAFVIHPGLLDALLGLGAVERYYPVRAPRISESVSMLNRGVTIEEQHFTAIWDVYSSDQRACGVTELAVEGWATIQEGSVVLTPTDGALAGQALANLSEPSQWLETSPVLTSLQAASLFLSLSRIGLGRTGWAPVRVEEFDGAPDRILIRTFPTYLLTRSAN
ncbi:MAG: hypothetical protein KC561_02935 [Myxococcales bacterium]|nr:hypothetical protein [Myxococcales bacterium]